MALVKILVVTILFGLAFWAVYSFGGELRVPAIFLLIVLLRFYSSDTFRNWRLRRKLERISRENMKRIKNSQ